MFKQNGERKVIFDQYDNLRVVVSLEAMVKMTAYTEFGDKEIGWLGSCKYNREHQQVSIFDVYLPKQEVSSATTEIDPEAIKEIYLEALEKDLDMNVWGHSHASMGANPSGQDDKQILDFQSNGCEYFVRLITNKKGDIHVTFYDFVTGITILHPAFGIDYGLNHLRDEIKAEIKEKVSDIKYNYKPVSTSWTSPRGTTFSSTATMSAEDYWAEWEGMQAQYETASMVGIAVRQKLESAIDAELQRYFRNVSDTEQMVALAEALLVMEKRTAVFTDNELVRKLFQAVAKFNDVGDTTIKEVIYDTLQVWYDVLATGEKMDMEVAQ